MLIVLASVWEEGVGMDIPGGGPPPEQNRFFVIENS
ncbi:hypothetical protein DESC_720280 [Desulfosarcina cetonica]|nr:hypothetical protein DESC_720280 [Desulfosarcina cetonica]